MFPRIKCNFLLVSFKSNLYVISLCCIACLKILVLIIVNVEQKHMFVVFIVALCIAIYSGHIFILRTGFGSEVACFSEIV